MAFIVRWKRPRRAALLPELNEYPATPAPPTAQGFPAWAAPREHKFRFIFRHQLLELNEYPATPAALTAEGYPAWRAAKPHKTEFRFKLQTLELAEFPATPGPANSSQLNPEFVTHWGRVRKRLVAPDLPWASVTAPAPTAEDYPAWEARSASKIRFTYRLQHVDLSEFPTTPVAPSAEGYPAWQSPRLNQPYSIRFDVSRVPHPEGAAIPAPAPVSAWQLPRQFRISFKRSQALALELGDYPATPAPTDQPLPAWAALKTRKVRHDIRFQRLPGLDEYPATPFVPTAQEYPAWRGAAAGKISFKINLQRLLQLNEHPATPPAPGPASVVDGGGSSRKKPHGGYIPQPRYPGQVVIPRDLSDDELAAIAVFVIQEFYD